MNDIDTSKIPLGGIKATYKGRTLGYFNTRAEAEKAIEKARKQERKENKS